MLRFRFASQLCLSGRQAFGQLDTRLGHSLDISLHFAQLAHNWRIRRNHSARESVRPNKRQCAASDTHDGGGR